MKQNRVVLLGLWLLCLLLPSIAFADVRSEARRHFRSGMDLIAQGQLDAGAVELEAAYQLMPHPNVLYNLARAYFDAGQYVETVLYFERYLKSDPPDSDQVQLIVDALKDRLAKQTLIESEPATGSEFTSADGTATVVTNEVIKVIREASKRFAGIAAATQSPMLKDQADVLEELARTLVTPTGDPQQPTAPTQAMSSDGGATADAKSKPQLKAENVEDLDLGSQRTEDIYAERVVSASRLAQSPLDAPNSTTVVTAQDIRLSGITNIGELLRRAAGIEVMTLTPADTEISIRGLNQRLSNKVLVLIDGRSVFLDFLGATLWTILPIGVEDIERIEVIRGPASALYGADAFSGVVNILLKKPGQGDTLVTTTVGEGTSIRASARFTGRSDEVGYRFNAGHIQSNQYSYGLDPARVDIESTVTDPEVGISAKWFNSEFNIRLPEKYTARVGTAVLNGDFSFMSAGRLRNLQAQDAFFAQSHANLSTPMGITLRSFWTAFTTDVKNLEGRPDDVDVSFDNLESHVVDIEAEYDATFDWPIPHHLNIGAGYRFKSIDWAWLNSKQDEHHASAFIQDTMKFGEYVRVTASTRIDKHPLISAPVLSPRGAVVVRMTEESALRATVGTAFRSPAFLESYLRSKVPTPLRGITAYGIGNTDLAPETMLSTEIGYSHQNDFFALEANVYLNLVDDLISLSQIENYGLTDPESTFDPSVNAYPVGELQWANGDVTYRQLGGELGVRVYPVSGLDVYLNYAYHDTSPTDSSTLTSAAAEEERTSAHKINGGIQYRSPFGLDVALDVHLASDQTWVQAISSATSGSDVGVFRVPGYAIVNARIGYRLFDDALELAVIGNNVASESFRQHPFGQKISRRIFGSATLRF